MHPGPRDRDQDEPAPRRPRPLAALALAVSLIGLASINLVFTDALRVEATREASAGAGLWHALTYLPGFEKVRQQGGFEVEEMVRLQVLVNMLGIGLLLLCVRFTGHLRRGAEVTLNVLLVGAGAFVAVLTLDPVSLGMETCAVRWFQSVTLVLVGMLALLNRFLVRDLDDVSPGDLRTVRRFWGLLTIAFCGAAFDERFQFHEVVGTQLGRHVEALRGASFSADDVLILILGPAAAVVALIHLRALLRVYRGRSLFAVFPFITANITALCVGLIEVTPSETRRGLKLSGYLEETFESLTCLLFLSAFLISALRTYDSATRANRSNEHPSSEG